MPVGVCPKLPADLRVADQEADRLGDFRRLDQSAQPCVRQDVLLDVFFSQHPHHRRVGEPRVYNSGMHPVEDRLFGQRRLGAKERLTPICMTALVTALGLLPLALGSGEAGREIEGPTAIVILGGLFTSTALNLLVLPTLALRYGWFEAAEARGEMPESAWNGIGRPASPAD
jgi:AcrB/AcrD/AcrF family